ncbi:hypothetical protein [Nakamurella lactea]|uniref:hypothetical protein n=1 Tax=Nakamurella lactea TaxID=459515 RepID=UPI000412736C|nr:hypothetical protein [Nakamurella lactea]
MSRLDEVGERDGWRCWLCDEPVDPQKSVNDARGPSVDSLQSDAKSRKATKGRGGDQDAGERLAHRACNTRKGAVKPVVPWPTRLFVSDPAPLIAVADRLGRKGGREVVARCPSRDDARQTADWLVDRFSRLAPQLDVDTDITPGGGQFLVALVASR